MLFFLFFIFAKLDYCSNYKYVFNIFLWKREESSKRLLNSLLRAEYSQRKVDLNIFFEYQSSQKLIELIKEIRWRHGRLFVTERNYTQGIEKNIISSWKPLTNSEFGFFFEDDIELHPMFFIYFLKIINQFKILPTYLAGIALTTPKYDEVNTYGSIWTPYTHLNSSENLFFFQQPCSWGAAYVSSHWKIFSKQYEENIKFFDNFIIPKSRVNGWTGSWKKYFIKYMLLNSLLVIYPLFKNEEGFSIHHRELSDHVIYSSTDYYRNSFAAIKEIDEFLNDSINTARMKIINFHHIETTHSNLQKMALKYHNSIKQKCRGFS